MGDFCMPSLGAEMDTGRLVEWYVTAGQEVHRGDVVAVVETDKANIEVEVFEDGVVEELLVAPGTRVPVGEPLARIGAATADRQSTRAAAPTPRPPPPPPPAPAPASPTPSSPAPVPAREPVAVATAGPTPRPAAVPTSYARSPLVRHLAQQRGIDLRTVPGSGAGGEITRGDVRAAATGAPARPVPVVGAVATQVAAIPVTPPGAALRHAPPGRVGTSPPAADTGTGAPPDTEDRAVTMRAAIARAMAASKREIPHYYLGTPVDLHAAMAWLADHNADRAPRDRLIPAALLCKATALAAAEFGDLNGFWQQGHHVPADHVHLGVAVALRGGGLVAPAIHDADRRTLDELMADLRDLVKRARAGGLTGSEMTDPTITVTNLGDQGVATVFPVIVPPQVAIVGFGRVVDHPVAVDGMLAVHPVVHATVAADHRVSDGHRGGLFLAAIDRLLQTPEDL